MSASAPAAQARADLSEILGDPARRRGPHQDARRLRDGHHVHLLAARGLFCPDYVAEAVPPGISNCLVRCYGSRVKFLMRQADAYPDLLQARCDEPS